MNFDSSFFFKLQAPFLGSDVDVFVFRCPDLVERYHFVIAIVHGILAFLVLLMFGRAVFTDPGIYPKGKQFS